uniref:tRNA-uridine aminocarboxypropyltransferase n=1 Tax=Gopherus agassizii TaxID=38772 RepID=A0A452I6B4_9SAUR
SLPPPCDGPPRPYPGSQPIAAFRGLLAPPGGCLPHRSSSPSRRRNGDASDWERGVGRGGRARGGSNGAGRWRLRGSVGAARGALREAGGVRPLPESRVLRTVPLLAACLPGDKCKVLIGRRFGEDRYPELAAVCRNSSTLILYPGAEAANLEDVALIFPSPSTIIIIDGTWSQAKDIFYKNSLFQLPKQVQLKTSISSQYVIRTQPTNTCLSTLECAAIALAIMEKNDGIRETILRPLQALCSFQLQHGAQIHHSKEHLLKNGLYDKPMPKNKRKLRRMELLVNNVKI